MSLKDIKNSVNMAPNLPAWKATKIDNILSSGHDVDFHTLANEYQTTYKTICSRNRRLKQLGVIPRVIKAKSGPPPLINAEMAAYMLAVLDRDPTLYQDEVADYLYAEFDVKVSNDQVSRALKREGWTKKTVTVTAAQQNSELVAEWRRKSFFWDAKKLVFVDESASNELTTWRRRGWGPRGAPAAIRRFFKKSQRWSVLPAYSIRGYMDPITFQGSITAQIFEDWLTRCILPACVEFGYEILIMDNASIHRSTRVEEICASFGIQVEYLPPYSPFLNPIEESFADLKAWIRRHWKWSDYTYEEFPSFLNLALKESGTGPEAQRRARGHFRNSGYQGVPDERI
jgi:transposase